MVALLEDNKFLGREDCNVLNFRVSYFVVGIVSKTTVIEERESLLMSLNLEKLFISRKVTNNMMDGIGCSMVLNMVLFISRNVTNNMVAGIECSMVLTMVLESIESLKEGKGLIGEHLDLILISCDCVGVFSEFSLGFGKTLPLLVLFR